MTTEITPAKAAKTAVSNLTLGSADDINFQLFMKLFGRIFRR